MRSPTIPRFYFFTWDILLKFMTVCTNWPNKIVILLILLKVQGNICQFIYVFMVFYFNICSECERSRIITKAKIIIIINIVISYTLIIITMPLCIPSFIVKLFTKMVSLQPWLIFLKSQMTGRWEKILKPWCKYIIVVIVVDSCLFSP